jgi:DNA-binding MltR family transcriptional regulator
MARKTVSILEAPYEVQIRYFKALVNESDRGLVLLTVSRLDELLEELHRNHIRSTATPEDKFINDLFAVHAPLSTFSAKIKLAFGYGLISKEDSLDMELLRSLRNDAAHTIDEFAFNLPEIGTKITKLTAPKRVIPELQKKFQKFGLFEMNEADRNVVEPSANDGNSTKMHVLMTGICLTLVIMDKINTILKRDSNKPVQGVKP